MISARETFLSMPMSKGTVKVFTEKPEGDFLSIYQIHSAYVIRAFDLRQKADVKGDGIVQYFTDSPLSPLAIVTADCLPVFVLGKKGIAALHAGWRGLAGGILRHSLVRDIAPLEAVFAPHIRAGNYRVGEEFAEHFPHSPHFFEQNGETFFDLTGEARDQLREQFPQIGIHDSGHCTYAESGLHSYRRGKEDERNWNLWLPNE